MVLEQAGLPALQCCKTYVQVLNMAAKLFVWRTPNKE